MENITDILQILLDGGLLFLCMERMFRNENRRNANHRNGNVPEESMSYVLKAVVHYGIIVFVCMAARVDVIAGAKASVLFPSQGFEIAPADNFFLLLFLILAVALTGSFYYKTEDSGYILCGSIGIFSIYLSARVTGVMVFLLCGASENVLLIGSRILSLLLAGAFLFSPAFEWCNRLMRNGGLTVKLASTNIALTLIVVLSLFSFDMEKFAEHLQAVAMLLLAMLLLDSILLIYYQHRMQERRRIQMIEQYVPIVEELISQVRSRQHEFNNRLIAIEAAVISAESLEEVRQSVSLLTEGILLEGNDRDLLACDSKIVAGMLYEKIRQASFLQIEIMLELQSGFKKSVLPETEWIDILGVLLDNAVEASGKGDTIYVRSRKYDGFIELDVANPFCPMSNTEFVRLFRKGVTTKARESGMHGYGLYNVLAVIERYHGKIITRNEMREERNYVVFGVKVSCQERERGF